MIEPSRDCPLCPRLKAFRDRQRADHPEWFNAPVPSFGSKHARLLVVGLAPGLRGANRTGRPFTGDYAGGFLYGTLLRFGFAQGTYGADAGDSLRLRGCVVTNAVRCVPPENKPTTVETNTCNEFLKRQIAEMDRLAAIVALGRVAHDATLKALGAAVGKTRFAHGARHDVGGLVLFDSYHCSRQNTNTGVLTLAMFEQVFAEVADYLAA